MPGIDIILSTFLIRYLRQAGMRKAPSLSTWLQPNDYEREI